MSHWHLVVDRAYPIGDVKFFPDLQHGVTATFPHQAFNSGLRRTEYRSGAPCLTYPNSSLGKLTAEHEPSGEYEKASWHAVRLIEWLEAAATDRLVERGQPFELPDLPMQSPKVRFAFREDTRSLGAWGGVSARSGRVRVAQLSGTNQHFIVGFDSEGSEVVNAGWGGVSDHFDRLVEGIWLRANGPLVLDPWRHPETWQDLETALSRQGLDFEMLVRQQVEDFRGQRLVPFVVGFPIPRYVGGLNEVMHWQAGWITGLASMTQSAPGWRVGPEGRWRFDRQRAFKRSSRISWILSENLHEAEMGTRGRLTDAVRDASIVLIGVGALGSAIAESLVRSGHKKLTLIDGDRLEAKNLVRHVLTMSDVGKNKAVALSEHLHLVNPNASITAIPSHLGARAFRAQEAVTLAEAVIDCTADDGAARHVAGTKSAHTRTFVSLWLGWKATSLHAYVSRARRFNERRFRAVTDPLVADEMSDFKADEAPREGIGCWHPVFPARHDEIQAMAGHAVKLIEDALNSASITESYSVHRRVPDAHGAKVDAQVVI